MTTQTLDSLSPALTQYRAALQTHCADQVERLILFGSQARGEATTESDIDLLVVVNWETERLASGTHTIPFTDPRWQQIVDLAYDVSLEWDVYLSPVVMSEREFQKWSPLVERIKAESVELWTRNDN